MSTFFQNQPLKIQLLLFIYPNCHIGYKKKQENFEGKNYNNYTDHQKVYLINISINTLNK